MQFTRGVRDLGGGLRVLRAHPSLWNWVLAPAIITALVFAGLVVGVLHLIEPITAWLHRHLPAVLDGVVTGALTAVVGVALSICALSVFVAVAGIVSGPFNEMLSERIELKLTGRPASSFSFGEFVHGALLGIAHGLRRLLASLFGLVLVFLVSLIPIVGTFAAIAYGVWLAAQAAAYDCYDAVLARRMLGYRAKLDFLATYRGRTTGLGAAVAGMMLVPGLNLIALGLGAASATVAALGIERDAAPHAAAIARR